MIVVELHKDGYYVTFRAGREGLTRLSGKKRRKKQTVTPTTNPDEAMVLLAKGVRELLTSGYSIWSFEGIAAKHLHTLVATHAPSAASVELVTLALANDGTRDLADGYVPVLAEALGLTLNHQSKQVIDPKEAQGMYTLVTMHSGCALSGTRMETFLAALAWRIGRPLVQGDVVIDPRTVLDKIDVTTRVALAKIGFAPAVLELNTAPAMADLVW